MSGRKGRGKSGRSGVTLMASPGACGPAIHSGCRPVRPRQTWREMSKAATSWRSSSHWAENRLRYASAARSSTPSLCCNMPMATQTVPRCTRSVPTTSATSRSSCALAESSDERSSSTRPPAIVAPHFRPACISAGSGQRQVVCKEHYARLVRLDPGERHFLWGCMARDRCRLRSNHMPAVPRPLEALDQTGLVRTSRRPNGLRDVCFSRRADAQMQHRPLDEAARG